MYILEVKYTLLSVPNSLFFSEVTRIGICFVDSSFLGCDVTLNDKQLQSYLPSSSVVAYTLKM